MPRTKPSTKQLAPLNPRPRKVLATKSARKSAPSAWSPSLYSFDHPSSSLPSNSSPRTIDLTDSPPPEDIPASHRLTTEESSHVSEEIRQAILSVPEDLLRSAILKVCTESPEATRLLGPLVYFPPSTGLERKRKRSVEICDECGKVVDDDGDGCCKSRRMRIAKHEAAAEELDVLDSILRDEICENCGEIADDDDDGCCKYRRMQNSRRYELSTELEYGF